MIARWSFITSFAVKQNLCFILLIFSYYRHGFISLYLTSGSGWTSLLTMCGYRLKWPVPGPSFPDCEAGWMWKWRALISDCDQGDGVVPCFESVWLLALLVEKDSNGPVAWSFVSELSWNPSLYRQTRLKNIINVKNRWEPLSQWVGNTAMLPSTIPSGTMIPPRETTSHEDGEHSSNYILIERHPRRQATGDWGSELVISV